MKLASINEVRNSTNSNEKREKGRQSERADTHAQLVYSKRKGSKSREQAALVLFTEPCLARGSQRALSYGRQRNSGSWAVSKMAASVGLSMTIA